MLSLIGVLVALATAVAGTVAAVVGRRRSGRSGRSAPTSGPAPGPWLVLPPPPPVASADDTWVLDAFTAEEIAELRRVDAAVRRDVTHRSHVQVMARVPESRRARRVRSMGWTAADLASTRAGRLTLELAAGISVELDGVSRATAVWLRYCHDQFGVVLEAISPTDATWAARVECCGWDTPVAASRLRVA